MLPTTVARRLWKRVDASNGVDSCWSWLGTSSKRYGRISVGTKMLLVHRVAYELTFGSFDSALDVLHRCDNPPCCNPKHLFLGTHQDNMDDRGRKGRQRTPQGDEHYRRLRPGSGPRGEKHGCAILSQEQVNLLRSRYPDGAPRGAVTMEASLLGVSKTTVSRILRGKTWKQND